MCLVATPSTHLVDATHGAVASTVRTAATPPRLWRWTGSTTPETRLAHTLQKVARDRRPSRGCHARKYLGRSDEFLSGLGRRGREGPQPEAVLGRGASGGPRGPR